MFRRCRLADLDSTHSAGSRASAEQWTAREPTAKEAVEDAVIFHVESEEKPTAAEFLSRSIFREVDRIDPHIWLIVIVALFFGTLMFCVLGACGLAMMNR